MKSRQFVAAPVASSSSHSLLTLQQIIVALGVIGLLIFGALFLSARTHDAGQIGNLLSKFFSELVQQPVLAGRVLMEKLGSIVIVCLTVISWYGVGAGVRRVLRLRAEAATMALTISWNCATGAAILSLLWFALGLFQLFRPVVAVLLTISGLVLAGWEMKRIWRGAEKANENIAASDGLSKIMLTLLLAILFLGFIAALAPITGKDALVYRYALPKMYVQAGGFMDAGTNVYSYLSFGAEMNGIGAMLLANLLHSNLAETAFNLTAFAYFPLLLLAIFGALRSWGQEKSWALCGAFIVAAIPSMFQVATTGYVDHALALYILLAAVAAGNWWEKPTNASLISLALALSGALAIKFIALFAFFALVFVVLLKARAMQGVENAAPHKMLWQGVGALCAGGLLASPWYLRVWWQTGSPLFPFYAHLWKGSAPGWDADKARLFQMWVGHYGGAEKNILDYLFAPVKLSLQAQPEFSAYFDGVLGITFLLGLPLFLWGLWRLPLRAAVKIASGIAGGWYLLWLFTSEQLRFLLPALPLITIGLIAIAARISAARTKALRMILWSSALPGVLVICSWWLEQNPVRAALGGEAREAYLARRFDYFSYYQIINRDLPPDAKVWLINMRNDTVHIQRKFLADYIFEDYTLTEFVKEAKDVATLRAKVNALGVTHIMLRHDVLLDYAHTPIVDEKKSEAENRAQLEILKSFLTTGTKVIKQDNKFMLLAL